MNRFHEAAREGHLDLLRDATRRDANKPDDTGRTPTVWAAYEGNTDALRLLVSRGGNPDLCDIQGHTALHYAALSGHVNTVTFLVSFGCNVWSLTNDYRTAKDLAAENNHKACLAFLDEVAAEQSAKSPKEVKKLKEKALVEADKRVKKLRKMQAEHTKWLKKEEKKESAKQGGLYKKKAGGRSVGSSPVVGRAHEHSHRHSTGALFSEITSSNGAANKRGRSQSSLMPGTSYSEDNRSGSTAGSRSSISEGGNDNDSGDEDKDRRPDIREQSFWQPAFAGSMIQSLPPRKPGDGVDTLEEDLLNNLDIEHDYRTTNSDPKVPQIHVSKPEEDRKQSSTDQNSNGLDWNPDVLDDDDDEDVRPGTSDLEFFLATHNLLDYLPVFTGEEIDLTALMLLSDDDFMKLGLPLGPRRKLTDAISRRRHAMNNPGVMTDTHL
ncbi:Usher syndrome type-1G protein homolog [Patiria miniata]|uniref:SAM domain-containing protein n=1 Tax=Patiria miniata TaxID=46514 RepID=A0A914AMD8_PATMI|nr:Usher syndrome type-1G protein homolog [Patiria miniata]XP_038064758.1 Usher syndrome type-1G protein homolog [Patiria miniata]